MLPRILKPPPISSSSTVAVLAPASAALDDSSRIEGIRALESRGLTVIDASLPGIEQGYLSAPDELRAQSFNTVLNDSNIDAIICLRGGYGSMRILDRMDYEAAQHHPKLLVGYSDITALHCAFFTMAGWTAIQGPMVAVDWPGISKTSEASFWDLASGSIVDPINGPAGEPITPFRTGTAEGRLIGGNLSMLVRLLQTPFFPRLDGAILFLEEIAESPYRVDAMFAQLRLAGVLDKLGGLVLAEFTKCTPPTDRPTLGLDQVIIDYFGDADYPVATGLQYGHIPEKTSMPFGVSARLEVSSSGAHLAMLEPVTDTDFTLS